MKLKEAEWDLILSALRNDRVGTWGDGRGEAIEKLTAKIKQQLRA